MNRLCDTCTNKCKQADSVILVECPKYKRIPTQLSIKFQSDKCKTKERRKETDD